MPTQPATRPTQPPTTPVASRVANAQAIQPSPHYATTRRHSLYGVEDRVIIDPGSRIWKVGFSGEGRPRDVFYAVGPSDTLWNLSKAADPRQRAEEDRMLEIRLQKCLRSVFHDSLMTDPKARKVILVEHPLLPLYIKELIAKLLFDNHVPSVSFASSHLLSLLSVGRITGLVVDCGHLESVALPIFASRPLFPQLRTTPQAGCQLTQHLRALLLMFGTYIPPLATLSSTTIVPESERATRVPQEILTEELVEEIKTRCCFVSEMMPEFHEDLNDYEATPSEGEPMLEYMDSEPEVEPEVPPSDDMTPSESEFSTAESSENMVSQAETSESPSQQNDPRTPASEEGMAGEGHLQGIANLYKRYSTATTIRMRVTPAAHQPTGTGQGTLVIPGWIRERAAEVLFEGGDIDESSLAELILDVLLKTPVDLRKTLACSILVIGGTAMLPGFIPRLHAEILRCIQPPITRSHKESTHPRRPLTPVYDRYASLRSLVPYISILNNPSPPPPNSTRAAANAGKAPAFAPSLMAWVGGSLAGSLKTGGTEVSRERWDEADAAAQNPEQEDTTTVPDVSGHSNLSILPDWTRGPLPDGAPPANEKVPSTPVIAPRTPQATPLIAARS
ncbi:hypothetical protein AGABI1DRAFT_75023 [Agaricus bisporus var. burnettii JB137-S8]|uniref:Actin-domain-containing protein n=1 Tax=Agaricus bisporus var. burnettii (strain JB137-S8 / ATCC MYA-4627 / FGSC 10392) TaxID=597362 RepID=K5WTC1_AGABU|nr:uncharacterized protein AGABI1DRAFT_75023 [Agaricus bisporus var. burnettii JB137-S8]EKM78646.1 hypothetical protein AGABI1DRAFT_75023 [Agaricus bisporus var. burnettii JB137-S8]